VIYKLAKILRSWRKTGSEKLTEAKLKKKSLMFYLLFDFFLGAVLITGKNRKQTQSKDRQISLSA